MRRRVFIFFFFSSRRRHTRLQGDWSSDVCSSDLYRQALALAEELGMRPLLAHCHRDLGTLYAARSEERRVGKECRSRWSLYHLTKKLKKKKTKKKTKSKQRTRKRDYEKQVQ